MQCTSPYSSMRLSLSSCSLTLTPHRRQDNKSLRIRDLLLPDPHPRIRLQNLLFNRVQHHLIRSYHPQRHQPTSPSSAHSPTPAPHKPFPHALARAAHTAATTVSTTAPSGETDRLGKALGLCAQGWERVAGARLDQDANIADNFLHP